MANTKVSTVYGVNENGEIVATSGTGTTSIVGFVPANELPVDGNGRMVIAGLGAGGGAGTNGKTILNGAVDPAGGIGTDGDFYVNTATNYFFGPKAAGAWPAGISIVGPAGNGSGGPGLPTVSSTVTTSVTTPAPATSGVFTAFPPLACTELHIRNRTGVEIEYSRTGAASTNSFISIEPGGKRRIVGITDASQIAVRRSDWADASAFAIRTSSPTRATTITAEAITSTETFAGAAILNLTMNNGGGGNDLPSQACTGLEIINHTGKDLSYRTSVSAPYVRLYAGETTVVLGITNANQIHVQPADAVIDTTGRPVMVETFTSGLRDRLTTAQPQTQISAEANINLGDMRASSKMPTGVILKMGELARGQRKTLVPKGVRPISLFPDLASTVTNAAVDRMSDATDGEIIRGTSHVEFTQAAFGTYNFAPNAALTTPIDITGGMVRFTCSFPEGATSFRSSNTGALNSLKIQLFSSGSPSAPPADSTSASLIPQAFITVSQAKRVFSFSISAADFKTIAGAGANLSAVTWARFQLNTGSAGNGAQFRPIAIEYVPNVLSKTQVIFSVDDFHSGIWTFLAPALAKYGWSGVMFGDQVSALGSSTGLTAEQVRILHQWYGWQVANQNTNGETNAVMSNEQALQEHSKFHLWARALGVSGTDDSSYGTGSGGTNNFRDDNMPALRRMHRTGVQFNGGPLSFGETAPFGDPYGIRRMNMSSFTAGNIYTGWKAHVDQAVANKGVAIFGAHGEFNTGSAAENFTALNSLLDYVYSLQQVGTVEVVTLDQAVEKIYFK